MSDGLWLFKRQHEGGECIILGNGLSLPRHLVKIASLEWAARPFLIGLNQSWKLWPNPEYHVTIDKSQYDRDEQQAGFDPHANQRWYQKVEADAMCKTILFTSEAWRECATPDGVRSIGIHLPTLGRPYTWSDDVERGVVVSIDGVGTVAYVALQLAAWMGFERIWLAGFDQQGPKFSFVWNRERTAQEPERARCERQDELFARTPEHVKERVRVMAPSATKVFRVVGEEEWPW